MFQWLEDPIHIMIIGAVLAQLSYLLPNGKLKDVLQRVLHGVFPSPQVALGFPPAVTSEEKAKTK